MKITRKLLAVAALASALALPPTLAAAQQAAPAVQATQAPLPVALRGTFRSAEVTAAGQRFHYVRGGRGEPVILLHGFPQTWREWQGVMPRLAAAGYDVIAVDLPGIGKSTNPDGDFSKAALARDIDAFARALNVERAHVAGHDIGAMVAYAYAAQFPDRTLTLSVSEAPLPGTETFRRTATDPRAWHFSFNAADEIPEALVRGREDIYVRDFLSKVGGGFVPPEAEIQEYVRAYSEPATLNAGFGFYRAFARDTQNNERFMRTKLRMPVLALSAGKLVPEPYILAMMQPLAEDATGAAVDAGHWLNEEQPDEVARLLVTHFQRGRTAAADR